MPVFSSLQLLSQLRRDTEELIRIANGDFSPLQPQQLLWKPAPEKWSIAGCLEHLNRYGLHYLPAMESRIGMAAATGSPAGSSFRSGWLGNFLVRTVQPMNTGSAMANKKYPSPKAYDPNKAGTVSPGALPEFLRQQHAMLRVLNEAHKVNLEQVMIPVSITDLIRLRLGDCLRFVIVHNQRHIAQAQKVLSDQNFPRPQ
jgi:hypothetical protein